MSKEIKKNKNLVDNIDIYNFYKISVGDDIKVYMKNSQAMENNNIFFTGTVMPRYESSDKEHIVLKLKSGYNVGIKLSKIKNIEKIISSSYSSSAQSKQEDNSSKSQIIVNKNKDLQNTLLNEQQQHASNNNPLPKILLISTGGTIASKIDYRTGAVTSMLSASDLYSSIPELSNYGEFDTEVLFNEYSENIEPLHWQQLAEKIGEKIKSGLYSGIIVSHGTDTMGYTAAALSFALQNLPIPIVLVGAQRSSDRPSSDAALNLIGSTIFAINSKYAGVYVAMHENSSDNIISCHIGTRVRKNHTSKRGAFKSIDVSPISSIFTNDNNKSKIHYNKLVDESIVLLERKISNNSNNIKKFILKSKFDNKVFLLKFYPGFDPKILSHIVSFGYKAIIIEGTGLGHVNKNCISYIKSAIESGVFIFMTSQCIWGTTRMTVYDTGRDLLNAGVIPLSNMLSETAVVKAMWILGNYTNITADEIKNLMQMNISNEIISKISIS